VPVIAVGLTHKSAPLALLERAAVTPAQLPKALADLAGRSSLSEAVILSTCMRTEVYAVADRFHPAVSEVRDFLCQSSFVAPEEMVDHLLVLFDDDAVRHLFAVTAGLDSAVVGETEVQGQVRDAWLVAREEGTAGAVLSGLFRHALEAGKRARAETGVSRGATSVSQAAVALAAQHLGGSLAEKRLVVLGAGEMGEGMAAALARARARARRRGRRAAGVADVVVANRSPARAAALAERIGGRAIGLDALPGALAEADVLLCSTGAPEPILYADDIAAVMAARDGRALLIVDIAVPRDVDPASASVAGVTVLDLDDLSAFAAAGRAGREAEIVKVQTILDAELSAYLARARARDVAPTVASLRAVGERVRQDELERVARRLADLDPRQRRAVESLSEGIVAKLLHDPSVRLRDAAGTSRGERLAEAVRVLFDLED